MKKYFAEIYNLRQYNSINSKDYLQKLTAKREEFKKLILGNKLDETNYYLLDKIISQEIEKIRVGRSSGPTTKQYK
jgi:hypothetical protein